MEEAGDTRDGHRMARNPGHAPAGAESQRSQPYPFGPQKDAAPVSSIVVAARRLSVLSLPTTFIFDADGRQRYRSAGVPKAADLRNGVAASVALNGLRTATISNMSARLELGLTKRCGIDLCRTAGCCCRR